MPITKSNAAESLAAVRRLSETGVNRPSRSLRAIPLVEFVVLPAPPEPVPFTYASFLKSASADARPTTQTI